MLIARWPAARAALVYDRALIMQGEWWRVATGNLVHFSASHLLWNGAILAVCGSWSERLLPTRARLIVFLSGPFIGLSLLTLVPGLEHYAGLSGVAAALLVFLAVTKLRSERTDRLVWTGALLALLLKVGWEHISGGTLLAEMPHEAIKPVPLAHVAGALFGAVVAFADGGRKRSS